MKTKTKLVETIKKLIKMEVKKQLNEENTTPKLSETDSVMLAAIGNDDDDISDLSSSEFKEFLEFVKNNYSESEILKEIEGGDHWMYPSFDIYKQVEYPAFLAKALVQSSNSEPMSDLWNMYYQKRKISKDARKIFYHTLMSKPKTFGMKKNFKEFEGESGLVYFLTGDAGASDDEIKDYIENYGFEKIPEIKSFLNKFYPNILGK